MRLTVLLLLVIVATPQSRAQPPGRPNVVVITVDDLDVASFNTLVANGLMPQLKARMLDQGYTFTQSFVTTSLCCPSRAAFLSGQYNHNNHARTIDDGIVTFDHSSTLATWLDAAGYRTGLVGKYLNLYGIKTLPTWIPPGWDDWHALVDPTTNRMYDFQISSNGVVGTYSGVYQTDALTQKAAEFILSSAPERPFFLWVNPAVPHVEGFPIHNECGEDSVLAWGTSLRGAARHSNSVFGNRALFPLPKTPAFNEADVSDKPSWVQALSPLSAFNVECLEKTYWRRLESMRSVDDMVWYLFQTLAYTGAITNTVVIFTSDNGYMLGDHRMKEKLAAYEPSIRVPLVVRMPTSVPATTVTRMALNIDLAPTIAELAGAVPTLTIDGRSLVPFLHGLDVPTWRHGFLLEYWHWQPGISLPPPPLPPIYFGPSYAGLRADDRTFVESDGVTEGEYYDLTTDPYQLQNLYHRPDRQAEVQFLRALTAALRTCSGVTCR